MKVVVYYQAHIGNKGGVGGGLAGRRREGANDRNDIPPLVGVRQSEKLFPSIRRGQTRHG